MRNQGNYVCALYIDLTKAFDTVSHKILIKKLEHYGIRGTPLKLITSYLTNRYQYTALNGVISTLLSIPFGVPQGSILGPLLFIVFVNDLVVASTLNIKLFADDTCLFYAAKSIEELQNTINIQIRKIDQMDEM